MERVSFGDDRELRGGAFDDRPGSLRSAYRDFQSPGYQKANIGFRVARTFPGSPTSAADVHPILPAYPKPDIAVRIASPATVVVGESVLLDIDVENRSTTPLTNIQLVVEFDPQLEPVEATRGFIKEGNNLIKNTIVTMAPEGSVKLRIRCHCIREGAGVRIRASVNTSEGERSQSESRLEIRPTEIRGAPIPR